MKRDEKGHLHPITQIVREIFSVFRELGFTVADGPELEDEFHNFDALNVPKDHPARDMQDTFWIRSGPKLPEIEGNMVLRTHTSSVQIRHLENNKPPVRIIVPGKVFRNEATDATHEAQFNQIEMLYVDKNVSLAHLKGTLETMFRKIYGDDVEIRFRPSFFPFVEPGVEVDMKWKGKWLEIGGAGLVHPNVLRAAGVDPDVWQGFAFGCGLDRLAILKFGIDDIRLFYNGDLRMINQF
jgi:phenylalanyl-tRNA synthetase alpha chain